MALSYAGVGLPVLTADLARRIQATLPTEDLDLWAPRPYGHNTLRWTLPPGLPATSYHPRLGHLIWPTGASWWSVGLFVATDAQLAQIRTQTSVGSSLQPASLVLSDNQRQITASMYLLAPRSLQGVPGVQGLWLLPLVDQRYWWWMGTTGSLVVTAGTTWASLYNSLATLLGITLYADTIPSAYLTASPALTAYDERIPPLLDTVAYNVGQRIVCDLDGTVHAYSLTSSKLLQSAEAAQVRPVLAGGSTASPLSLPRAVQVNFSRLQDGIPSVVRADVQYLPTDLGLEIAPTGPAVKEIRDTCEAGFTGATWTNQSECSALARQFATDWYGYQIAGADISYAGIADYSPNGIGGLIDWTYTRDMVCTRVLRTPYNDTPEDLYHAGSVGDSGALDTVTIDHVIFNTSPDWNLQTYPWYIRSRGSRNPVTPGIGKEYEDPGVLILKTPFEICGVQFWCCYTVPQWLYANYSSGLINDWAVSAPATVYRVSVDNATMELTGMAPFNVNGSPYPQMVVLANVGTLSFSIVNGTSPDAVHSLQTNRFTLPNNAASITVYPNESVICWYDTCQYDLTGYGTWRIFAREPPSSGATLTSEFAGLLTNSFVPATTYANSGLSLSLPGAGTWAIDTDIYTTLQASFVGSANVAIWARLYDNTNGAALLNTDGSATDTMVSYSASPNWSGQSVEVGAPLTALVTTTGSILVFLQSKYIASAGATVSSAVLSSGAGTRMRAIKVA